MQYSSYIESEQYKAFLLANIIDRNIFAKQTITLGLWRYLYVLGTLLEIITRGICGKKLP